MKCLDLFCCAGGAGRGYALAGFDVTGVDVKKQPNYPFRFIRGDAIEYLALHGHEYDFIHASPPCQAFTVMRHVHKKVHPELIEPTRDLLVKLNKPYIIENVVGAPLVAPIMLCGTMFNLKVLRHRLFESSIALKEAGICNHPTHGVIGDAGNFKYKVAGDWACVTGKGEITVAAAAMGIDPTTMTSPELSQAIPPAYTQWLGKQMFTYLTRRPQ